MQRDRMKISVKNNRSKFKNFIWLGDSIGLTFRIHRIHGFCRTLEKIRFFEEFKKKLLNFC